MQRLMSTMLPSPPADMAPRAVSSRKRSRSDTEADETRDSTFELENLSTTSSLTFVPVSRLLRAHLPLSWLGSAGAHSSLPSGTLLQGQIKHVASWEYSVLVSRQIPNGGLYALEKVDDGCFVVHPLQPFVTEKWIKEASIGAAPPVSMQMLLHYVPAYEPSQSDDLRPMSSSTVPDTVVKAPKNRRGAAARLSILSQSEKRDGDEGTPSPLLQELPQHIEDPTATTAIVQAQGKQEEQQPIIHTDNAVAAAPSMILDEPQTDLLTPAYLRQRYFDHLYKVKTSLAFYVKGPLSRARARARLGKASMTTADLANFYRESVLPAKKMDLKYKESLKDAVLKLVQETTAAEDEKASRKSTKRTKLAKDGLWPTEPDFIRFWWHHRDSKTSGAHEDYAIELQDAIAAQRMREAQMQMILILEILAIEAKQNEKRIDSQQRMPENSDVKVE